MSLFTKVRNAVTGTARVVAAPLTGGASLPPSPLKNTITGLRRVALAPSTGGFSLAHNRSQALDIARVHAVSTAAVGGAIVAPGSAAMVGKTIAGTLVATAAGRAFRPNPPPSAPQEVTPVQFVPGELTAPPWDKANPTIASGASAPSAPAPNTGKTVLGIVLAAIPIVALLKG